jgi:predicted HTH transcriptional regulator
MQSLLIELCGLTHETEWVEFKENKADPTEIGEYISALANAAALNGKTKAYLAWGVRDSDHAIVGTSFRPHQLKVGNEQLESWLLRLLTPKIDFTFNEIVADGKPVVLLEIQHAVRNPVQFAGSEYIRIGSYKKKLKEFPEKERALWKIFDQVPFENQIAVEQLQPTEIGRYLDIPAYFDLMSRPLPESRTSWLQTLQTDGLISPNSAGRWDVTNLGAILFAKRLDDFSHLKRKSVRVIKYDGTSRFKTIREQVLGGGYANGFEGLIGFLTASLPTSEIIRQALRKDAPVFPDLAIRELVANTLIHQDFFVTGAGPMIEIFDDRIELTNPGKPLISAERFVDSPPRSRNEQVASLMRRVGVCEERGSGWDKVVFLTEIHQLPAPLTETTEENTRVVLFSHRPLSRMDKDDRIRAIYLHACLRYVNREHTPNTSVRERFGIEQQNLASASRMIREAVEAGAIHAHDPKAAPRMRRYVPFWA